MYVENKRKVISALVDMQYNDHWKANALTINIDGSVLEISVRNQSSIIIADSVSKVLNDLHCSWYIKTDHIWNKPTIRVI